VGQPPSGVGNFGAAFSDFYGAFTGNVRTARQWSNYSQIGTSVLGMGTYYATGNVDESVAAANVEGVVLAGASMPTSEFARTPSAALVNSYDLGQTAADLMNAGSESAPACQ
jgi:hypothetical protein